MAQVLYSNQNRHKQPLPGHFFNSEEDIQLPYTMHYLLHRHRLSSGKGNEIDIFAAFSGGMSWVCESKWVTSAKIGVDVVNNLLNQAQTVQTQRNPKIIYKWIFAHEGFTKEAQKIVDAEGILWSTREQLDGLLTYLDLRPLPDLDD